MAPLLTTLWLATAASARVVVALRDAGVRNLIAGSSEMATAAFRFPVNTPDSKEAYYYRVIFEEHFPHAGAIACVPGGKSVACSTPEALAWDAKMAELTDPSGRAVRDVHAQGY